LISKETRVTSVALKTWFTTRRARIDQLMDAHGAVGGTGPGRRWRTEQLNWSLVLRLAAEFQGFARELHDGAAYFFADAVAQGDEGIRTVIRDQLTRDRGLDRSNASPGTLGRDYARLGLLLWRSLREHNAAARQWNTDLEKLNEARNAVAHDNSAPLVRLKDDGYPLVLSTIRRWQVMLDKLAVGMDDVVALHLSQLLGKGQPW
jgi:hypothetical protein